MILYIPHDPAHPFKRYSGSQMEQEFKRLFMGPDALHPGVSEPNNYQRFFSQFVPYDQRSYYFSQFTQKSADSPSDVFRSPWRTVVEFISTASSLTYIKELPPERPGKMEPASEPYIAPSSVTRKGRGIWAENVDLWTYLYEQNRDKVLADARSHAVPSNDVDVKAREAKLARLLQIGMLGVNMVSMFIPVLGEVMMVVMAGQLLYETLEGAVEWSEGDKRAAKAHLVDVAENLALIGVMAGVGAGVGKLTAVKPEPLIDDLHPVTLPNGETRLWRPDLGGYESRVTLDAHSRPNALGQHVIDGRTYIREGDMVYEKFFDESIQKWRIKHPTDANAYQPVLEGNGLGAWRHTLERPLTWDRLTLLRRMGHETEAFSDAALLRAADVSGVSDNALRKMHVDHAAPPPELTDAMRLFNADSGAGQVIEQLHGTRPIDDRYFHALPLVTRMPRWPTGRVLEVFEGPGLSGESIKYGTERPWRGDAGKPLIKVSRADVLKGALPTRILAALNESEITHLLGGEGARVRALRSEELGRQFADYAQTRQPAIFDALYKRADPGDVRISKLQRECPGLSDAAAREVLAHGSPDDLARLDATHRTPLKMLEDARWYALQGRQTRAYAGLRSENMASADSRRLALHALENLPGWPDTLRLEVRDGSDTGTLLDSIGGEAAPEKKYLIKNGPQYQAFNGRGETLNSLPRQGDNFYASIMHALPDDARSNLGVSRGSQSSELQRKIIDYADAHRSEAARVLEPQAKPFKPPVRVNEKLLGYYASGRGKGLSPSLISRVEALYPTPAQADAFIRQQLGQTEKQIYNVLETRTRDWQALNWSLDQWVGTPGSSSFHHRTQVAQAFKTSWRNTPLAGEVSEAAQLNLICDEPLPPLTTDFSHVRELSVAGRGMTDANADALLARFPNVRTLSIGGKGSAFGGLAARRQPLTSLPQVVGEMQALTHLRFSTDANSLAADFPTRLNALTSLESLDIDYSGFTSEAIHAIDLASFSQLKSLKLNAPYSLTQWPSYGQKLEQLERLDLSKTAISTLPDALFTGHEKLWAGLSMDWSRFSVEAFKPAFEYASNYSGPLGHLADVNQMVNEYCRGELKFLMGDAGFMDPLHARIMSTWNTPRTRLAAIEALSAEHTGIFRPFYEPTGFAGLRWAQRSFRSVSGHNASVFLALETSWRGAVRQRYGLVADVSVFELPNVGLRMSEVLRDEKIKTLPRLPAGSFSHVQTLRLGWLDVPIEQTRGFVQAFSGTRTLEISGNGLTELPIVPGDLPDLTRLDLYNNRIVVTPTVQNQFNGLKNLEYLNAGNNPLNNLDVSAMTQLKALNLRGTKLQAWPKGAESLPQLSWLDLRDNGLTSLSPEALSHEDALMKTSLTGNAFSVQGEASLKAAQQRIENAKGLSEGTLQRFAQEAVPSDFPPTETGWSIARNLLSLPEQAVDIEGAAGFVERLRRLNPVMTEDQALQRIQRLRSDGMNTVQIDTQINDWNQTCVSLTRRLNSWLYTREVRTAGTLVSSETRSFAALRIQELWQEGLIDHSTAPGQELKLNGLQTGDLPELEVQFPQVTTLDLTGVRLTAQGSNDFLNAFPRLNSLALSGNELTQLPSAVQHMSQLERLELAANHIADPVPLYQQLGTERLRWLDLSQNTLDGFSVRAFSRLETLDLGYNGLRQWPEGALDAGHLSTMNLSGNSITQIPGELLNGNHDGLVAGTDLSDNLELSLQTLEQLRDYGDANGRGDVMGISREEIIRRIEDPLTDDEIGSDGDSDDDSDGDSDSDSDGGGRPDTHAVVQPVEPLLNPGLDTADPALEPWLANTRSELAIVRRVLWRQLAQEENHERFFQLITLLRDTDEFRFVGADLTRRLWDVMEAAAENTELRELLFHNAETHGTCIDGRILTFSELEVRVYVYHALRNIPPGRPMRRGQALLRLSRQLFRLDRVETLADAAAQHRDRAEVRLRYRIGLRGGWADGLDLPGQPTHMAFDRPISGRLLADTRASILAAEHSDALLDSMVARDYWTSYLEERYPDEIAGINDAIDEERQQGLSELEDRRERGDISAQDYDKEVVTLGKIIQASRKQKLIELSRREVRDLQSLASNTEQPGTREPQPGPSRRN